MTNEEIEAIIEAVGYLEPATLVKVARSINYLAGNYLAFVEEHFDTSQSITELIGLWQISKAAELLNVLGHTLMPRQERKKAMERKEQVNWAAQRSFREGDDTWNQIFSAEYGAYSIVFATPVTDGQHIGYVKLTFRREGQPDRTHNLYLDRNGVLDWQLGLSFIAGRMMRSPETKLIFSETGSDDEKQDDDQVA
jgi:hypothetical protein